MPEPNRRAFVNLCHDVIAQVRAGALKPTTGLYLEAKSFPREDDTGFVDYLNENYTPALNQLAKDLKAGKKGVSCQVCAKGAMFIKALEKGKAKADRDEPEWFGKWAEQYMTPETYDHIERAFEWQYNIWADAFPNPKHRLVAIMLSVIRDKGLFNVHQTQLPSKKEVMDALRMPKAKPKLKVKAKKS